MTARRERTFLVTGGSGLLGSRLVRRLLEEGQRVRVLDTRIGELRDIRTHPKLELIGVGAGHRSGGMLDKATVYRATRSVSVIYHLAINWNGYSWRHSLALPELFDANIRGTLNLLEAARSGKIEHFLVASSAAVYGETQRTLSSRGRSLLKGIVDEESVCKPYLWDGDPGPGYAVLKLVIENLCLMYHHTYTLPVTVFRIEYVFTNMEQFKDGANVHVDDVVRAFSIATLNRRSYGQVFNLAHPV
ncbi:MAG TPA: NAD(P)-dependent oxidoreductase, partial [Candidatus Bathyarchaeia archaeon]